MDPVTLVNTLHFAKRSCARSCCDSCLSFAVQKEKREMKITWKKKGEERGKRRSQKVLLINPDLPFTDTVENEESETEDVNRNQVKHRRLDDSGLKSDAEEKLADSFQSQGNKLAEEGKYREALGKWEASLMLLPEKAVLHEQKAQVLLEIGESWAAVKAATRATELEPSWAEAWITLARAQLNFGEPDASIESFDKALAIKPDSEDGKVDRETAIQLVKRREQLNSSGELGKEGRILVRNTSETL